MVSLLCDKIQKSEHDMENESLLPTVKGTGKSSENSNKDLKFEDDLQTQIQEIGNEQGKYGGKGQ